MIPGPRQRRGPSRSGALIAFLPVAIAGAWVVELFAQTGTPTWALWRPLLVALAAAILLEVVLYSLIRRVAVAAVMTAICVLSVAGIWVASVPMVVGVALWIVVGAFLRRHDRPAPSEELVEVTAANLGFLSVALLGVVLWQAASSGAFWLAPTTAGQQEAADTVVAPDIYLIMLDGYPGSNGLQSHFGIDNTPFEQELRARGFSVAGASRSNYTVTPLSLASLFQMRYVQDLPPLRAGPQTGPGVYRELGMLINDAPSLEILRRAGYKIVSSHSAFSETALTNADEVLPTPGLTRFEEQLVEQSAFASLAKEWMLDSQKRDLEIALDRPVQVAAERQDAPVFMFDHVFSPHPPFLFEAVGSPRRLGGCFPTTCRLREGRAAVLGLSEDEYATALREQLRQLNDRLLATVDRLVRAKPGAVIVLFSDHGTRHDLDGDPTEANLNFLAARTPGAHDLFAGAPLVVNILPTLFNRYIDTDLTISPFRSWISIDAPLNLRPLGD